MKKINLITLLLAFCIGSASAQDENNLVNNYDFEEVEGKLKKAGQISMATGWMQTTGIKVDLFEEGNASPEIGIPLNAHGKQEALSGSHYSGFIAYSYNNRENRSYLSTQLKKPLKGKSTYCVKYYVSLAELSRYGVNNLGAYFTKKSLVIEEKKDLSGEAQVKHQSNKVFNNTSKWELVCGTYTAKGGEKFLNLGNFDSNSDTRSSNLAKAGGFDTPQKSHAYYYVDAVQVYPVSSASECDCSGKGGETRSSMVYSKSVKMDPAMPLGSLLKNATVYFDVDKSRLEATAKKDLDVVAGVLQKDLATKIELVGHTDAKEFEKSARVATMKTLGTRRAQEVKKYLVSKGIQASRISVGNKDASDPVDSMENPIAYAKNRRVEFKLID